MLPETKSNLHKVGKFIYMNLKMRNFKVFENFQRKKFKLSWLNSGQCPILVNNF